MKLKKRKKKTRLRGTRLHGWAAKKHKGRGNKGGKGMSGTGKRGDQKKTLIIKHSWPYFGKKGLIRTKKRKKKGQKAINLRELEEFMESLIKKGRAKRENGKININLENYKVLGCGDIKSKIILTVKDISQSAEEKIKSAGGEVIVKGKVKEKTKDGP